jgi:PAS domain S-box-containing protein
VLRAEGIRSGVIIPLQEKSEIRNTKSETNSNDQNPEVSDFDIRASNFPAGAEVFPLGLLILAAREEPGDFSQYFDGFFALLASLITNLLWPHVKGPQTTDHEPQTTDLLPSSVVHRPSSIVGLQEALVGHSSSGVVAVDRDGRITLFNPAMEQLIGYWQGEVLGSQVGGNYLTFLSGVNPFVATLQSGQEAGYGELALLQRDGGRKLVAAKIVPLKDENGATVGALGLFNDLTSMRALEQERHRLAPLALIGEMAARLAHEIKNPLASMMSGLELLQRRLSYGEQEGRYFQRVLSEMKRLDMTIREMLAFSRPAPLQFAPVGSCDPLERALEALEPQMEASHVRVIRSYAPDLQPVVMDENQMEQVFLNLLLNAMQAMPEGGTLRVSVRQVTRPDLEHELGAAPAFVEYIIQDSGVGIPESAISKIFDPFFSTKTHGTGLGLATVKKVIDGHQGHIRVQSQPGSGTMFTIYLPSSR